MRSRSDLPALDAGMASRLAAIALGHVGREYPNKLDHVLTGRKDVKSPRALHPVFYGSFDWHSCVHSYWLLATLDRLYPHLPENGAIRALFQRSFTRDKIDGECAYLARESASLFERPYGWARLQMLQAELDRHESRAWSSALKPLSHIFATRFHGYLPKATYPTRTGTHGNSAFALALSLEYAQTMGDAPLAALIRKTARRWFSKDEDCQAWEPSGEDFLSSALTEALLMQRVLSGRAFESWLSRFLPRLASGEPKPLFLPARVSDRTDGRIVHLDGLNLSRAWCWRRLAESISPDAPLQEIALHAARRHFAVSKPYLTGHYMGEHWLASFTLLALRPDPL